MTREQTHSTLISGKKCPICGREHILHELKSSFGTVQCFEPTCDCEEKAERLLEEKRLKEKQHQLLMERYKLADIPKRFDGWNFERVDDSENKKFCIQYVKCFDWNFAAGNGIFMIGDTGTRKTTHSICIIKELLKLGKTAGMFDFGDVLRQLSEACMFNSKKSVQAIISDLLKFDFILFDDFGRETYTDARVSNAAGLIDALWKAQKCVCITANREVVKQMKNPASNDVKAIQYAERMRAPLSRLAQMCKTTLVFDGPDYRLT